MCPVSRELPEPVLTAELLPLFDSAAGQKAPERRVQQLSELLGRLPDPNRILVQYMFKHMEHIIKRVSRLARFGCYAIGYWLQCHNATF